MTDPRMPRFPLRQAVSHLEDLVPIMRADLSCRGQFGRSRTAVNGDSVEGDPPGPDCSEESEGRPHRRRYVARHAKQHEVRLGRIVEPNLRGHNCQDA
jgi:hypothetical protein